MIEVAEYLCKPTTFNEAGRLIKGKGLVELEQKILDRKAKFCEDRDKQTPKFLKERPPFGEDADISWSAWFGPGFSSRLLAGALNQVSRTMVSIYNRDQLRGGAGCSLDALKQVSKK